MKIVKAEHMGFCFGVKKAIERAEEILSHQESQNIYMLGELIHNPQVVNHFKKRGIKIVEKISEVPDYKYLITRAHGILLSQLELAKEHGIHLIDTTCPYVKKIHQLACNLKNNGYQIIIYGDKEHPEIKSLLSFINNNAMVIQDIKEISFQKLTGKIGLISQTTKNNAMYNELVKYIIDNASQLTELRMFKSICNATQLRQESTRKIAQYVDLMVVVGGKNSANTSRLANISKQKGVKTYHIENERQLNKNWFKGINLIGVTSGASTPDFVTENVIRKIKQYGFE